MVREARPKQVVIDTALSVFGSGDYPFEAETDGERLFFKRDWKDGVLLGNGTVSKETASFRYIVELSDKGTWHGYDMDLESMLKGDMRGKVHVSGSAFVGHEIRMRKEIAVDAGNGLSDFGFNTEEIHRPVKEFMTNMGWQYKEPGVRMTALEGSGLATYKGIGALFTLLGLAGTAMFVFLEVWPALILTGLFLALGIWALGVGFGKAWMPVFSVKATIAIVAGTFIVGYGLIFLVLVIVLLLNGGSL